MNSFKKGTTFAPVVGKCYAVHFGTISVGGREVYCSARIKVNGPSVAEWEDLDTGKPLDPRVTAHVVQAFKEMECTNRIVSQ